MIDKGLYWSTIIDDVTEKQQDIDQMNEWAQDAAEQMKITLDTRVLASVVPDVAAANKGAAAGVRSGNLNLGATGAPVALSKANILDKILELGQVLDEQNVPESGRYLILPYWATTRLKMSDLKDASITGDGQSVMRNGRVGVIDRFTVFNSNLLPTYTDGADTTTHILAGVKAGLTFATQLTKTETLRAESTFGEIMRGLLVYGQKVLKGEAVAALYAKQA